MIPTALVYYIACRTDGIPLQKRNVFGRDLCEDAAEGFRV